MKYEFILAQILPARVSIPEKVYKTDMLIPLPNRNMKKLFLSFFIFLSLSIFAAGQPAVEAYNRGFVRANIGDLKGAIQEYNKAIELDQLYADAYFNRGVLKYKTGNIKSAILDYNKAIELDPLDTMAYYNRGIAKFDMKDVKGAIKDYNKSIELNPIYAEAYYNRGIARYSLGNKTGCCIDLAKADELGLEIAFEILREYCN